jgi:hypothetical protein
MSYVQRFWKLTQSCWHVQLKEKCFIFCQVALKGLSSLSMVLIKYCKTQCEYLCFGIKIIFCYELYTKGCQCLTLSIQWNVAERDLFHPRSLSNQNMDRKFIMMVLVLTLADSSCQCQASHLYVYSAVVIYAWVEFLEHAHNKKFMQIEANYPIKIH